MLSGAKLEGFFILPAFLLGLMKIENLRMGDADRLSVIVLLLIDNPPDLEPYMAQGQRAGR
ncbi:hypothetical protein BEN74_15885 [Acinetobacter sp. WCHAc010034]|nr:hypothetical protein BEN74_15885 [Acinetobacter sp. WCHAc010034]